MLYFRSLMPYFTCLRITYFSKINNAHSIGWLSFSLLFFALCTLIVVPLYIFKHIACISSSTTYAASTGATLFRMHDILGLRQMWQKLTRWTKCILFTRHKAGNNVFIFVSKNLGSCKFVVAWCNLEFWMHAFVISWVWILNFLFF